MGGTCNTCNSQGLPHLNPFGPFAKAVCGKSVTALIAKSGKLCLFGECEILNACVIVHV